MSRLLAASILVFSLIYYAELAPTENYPYSEALASTYMLYWKYNDTHITFESHVQTQGAVGLGISANGSMFPGDIAFGFVLHNQGRVIDAFASDHVLPPEDKSQDWVLLYSAKNDNGTVLKFTRLLDTGDSEDFPIHPGVTHVIWSYTATVPQKPTDVVYHGPNRGSKDIVLIKGGSAPVGR